MVAIPLTSGAYTAASLIANAQRSVNMFPEANPEKTRPNMPTTQYVRPGLNLLSSPPVQGFGRCLYRSTRGTADPNGDLFAVVGQNIYFIDPNFTYRLLGQLEVPATTPVSMADNGTSIAVVDNSNHGYSILIATKSFSPITDSNFLGSTRVDFIDSFLIFNNPGSNEWYSTTSEALVFNGLFVGIKTAWPDNILCVVACEREVFVFGPQKAEPWYNAGAVPFPFQLLPGVIIEQGLQAIYSPAKMDTFVYYLSSSPEGGYMVMRVGSQNIAQRISNHAIEVEWKSYPRVDDAIGSVYQLGGHSFYRLHFPTADKTWAYDAATEQWWEDNWIDTNGVLHRARNTFTAFAYNKVLGLDWSNGSLYEITPSALTDAGNPIPWIRSFPHIVNELKWVSHSMFMADLETGTRPVTTGTATPESAPSVALRMSKDAGYTFGKYRIKRNISSGHYRSPMRWRNLGIARDAVLELSSTAQMCGALNGAYIDPIPGTA